MNQQNETNQSANNTGENKPDTGSEQTIAQNPNPRANENINHVPFEKKSEKEDATPDVGSEITDGEAG
jgi:hypothetical protein